MIIVTGGAGFIGSVFVHKLNQEGVTDIVIVDSLSTSDKWKNLIGKRFREFIHKNDFLSSPILKSKIDAIVHMGACSSTVETNADYLLNNNFSYSKELATLALNKGIRFIYASSAATYGDGSLGYNDSHESIPGLRPLNRYGFSKQLFDMWALETGALDNMVGLKFFNVYGPNEYHKLEMWSGILRGYTQIKETGKVKLFKSHRPDFADGEQKRDFVYVKDCAALMWWFLSNPGINGIFNVGTGKARSWNDLAKAVFAALELPPQIQYAPLPENLQAHYQYFTEANMEKLVALNCPVDMRGVEAGAFDYVRDFLDLGRRYL